MQLFAENYVKCRRINYSSPTGNLRAGNLWALVSASLHILPSPLNSRRGITNLLAMSGVCHTLHVFARYFLTARKTNTHIVIWVNNSENRVRWNTQFSWLLTAAPPALLPPSTNGGVYNYFNYKFVSSNGFQFTFLPLVSLAISVCLTSIRGSGV